MTSARCWASARPRRGGRASLPHGSKPPRASCWERCQAPASANATAGRARSLAPVSPFLVDLHVYRILYFAVDWRVVKTMLLGVVSDAGPGPPSRCRQK